MQVNNSRGQLTYQIDVDRQQKNGFPIPCDFFTTGKIGVLYPTQALPVTYGDHIKNTSSVALQFNPLAVPIMANMFIKQEHYYTPRNCVWQNWDNFISGGEDLTFITPPPSFSMQQLFKKLTSLLGVNKVLPINFIRDTFTNSGDYDLLYPSVGFSSIGSSYVDGTWKQELETFKNWAATYGVSDLYKVYIESVVNEIIELITDKSREHEYFCVLAAKWVKNRASYDMLDSAIRAKILPPDMIEPDYYSTIKPSLGTIYLKETNGSAVRDSNSLLELYLTDEGYKFVSLLWKLFKPFIGEGSYLDCLNMNRMTVVDFIYLIERMFYGYWIAHESTSLSDYSNWQNSLFETGSLSSLSMDALNLRTLYLIWYNNYRDQLLETQAMKPRNADNITDDEMLLITIPRHRCWDKDSYTTALDNPATADAVVPTANQRTHETITMKSFPVDGAGAEEIYRNDGTIYSIKFQNGETFRIPTGFVSGLVKNTKDINTTTSYFSLHMLDAVKRGQKFLRKALFYGNRIQDFVMSTWGVSHLDARLRLPEILATSSDMAEINTLVNNTTVVTDQSSTVAGDRAGLAKAYDKGNFFERYCEESGVIISMLTIMPQPTYAYGSDRQYYRFDRFDYPIPDFATLGMDAVFDSELVCLPTAVQYDSNDSSVSSLPKVFGYQGRYYDCKFRQSTEHGELLTTQDMYTFGRRWNMYDPNGRPVLNYEFVHCFPPLDMFVMEDQTEDYWRANVHHDTMASLTLPYHSIYL